MNLPPKEESLFELPRAPRKGLFWGIILGSILRDFRSVGNGPQKAYFLGIILGAILRDFKPFDNGLQKTYFWELF